MSNQINEEHLQKVINKSFNTLEDKINTISMSTENNISDFIETYKHIITNDFVTEFELKRMTSIIREKISLGAIYYNNKINEYSKKIKEGFKLNNNEISDYRYFVRMKHFFDELKYYIDDVIISDIVFIDGFVSSLHQNPELIKILWNLNDNEVKKVVDILDNLSL